jgi:hypothetical protein
MPASSAYLATSYSRSNCYHFSVLLRPFLSLCLLSFLYLPLPIPPSLLLPLTFSLSALHYLSINLQPFVYLYASFFSSASFIFFFHQPLFLCASSLFAMLFILPFHVRLMRLCNFFSFKLCLLPCPPMKIRPLLNSTVLHNASTHCP